MTNITLKDVNYIYSPDTPYSIHALKNINLTIESGDFIGVIGQTGSGKSSLMQIIDGLIKPTSGEVLLDGQDINAKDYDKKQLRRKVGMVFQYPEYQLFEENVLKDVCFGPKNMGIEGKGAELKAREALEMVDFPEEFYLQSPFFLSGGQKRKAAIAGILAMEPDVLILDEPTAGLDPEGREMILNLIKRLNQEKNMAIILVSHSMEDVCAYCERVLVMHCGVLTMDAPVRDVFSRTDALRGIDLDIPVSMKVVTELRKRGISVDDAMTISEASDNILREYRRRRPC
ncbi:MAG: energy-coupling factor transporter ATPase [Lachnospiraceae bacterium]|nr:energy-coupling factor transporter ATPase [Lachnospiraceae bacterium]